MNPTVKELLVITPVLLTASYGLMRLTVLLRRLRKKPGKPDCWQRRSCIWCVWMGLLSLVTVFTTIDRIALATSDILPYYVFVFFFFAVLFSIAARHKDDAYVPRDSAPEARRTRFYLAVAAELTLIPALAIVLCHHYSRFLLRALLGWMPVALALSPFLLNITVAASNKETKRDVHDPWSRFALAFSAVVAAAYPLCHAFAVSINEYLWVEDSVYGFWLVFSCGSVGFVAYYAIRTFYGAMNHEPAEETDKELPDLSSGGSYTPPARHPDRTPLSDPMDLYRSSYEDPDKAREDVFRQYDESRRISEDIQQFHRAHPKADLSDHYFWEDILDAETNGYLEEDEDS